MKLFRFNGPFQINIQQDDLKVIFGEIKEVGEIIPMDEESSNSHPWAQFLVLKHQQIQRYLSKSKFS